MRILKALLHTLLSLLGAAIVAVLVSRLFDREGGDILFSVREVRITVPGIGAALAILTMLLFALMFRSDQRKRNLSSGGIGNKLNALGFGLLPGTAVWKIFEQQTILAEGKAVFDPLPAMEFFTENRLFVPSRIEMVLAVAAFVFLVIWLIARRNDIPGNGDLFWTVLCVWGQLRAFTEFFRGTSFLRIGNIQTAQVILLLLSMIPLAVWTFRTAENKKSSALKLAEWMAVLICATATVLITSGTLTVDIRIGDLAVCAGCMGLSILLILLAGKDSRT